MRGLQVFGLALIGGLLAAAPAVAQDVQTKACSDRGLTAGSTQAMVCEMVRLRESIQKQSSIVIPIPIRGQVDELGNLTEAAKTGFIQTCQVTGYAQSHLIISQHFPTLPHILICYD